MGNDFYEVPEGINGNGSEKKPPLGIGPGTHIEDAIIDKNCRIGSGVRILNKDSIQDSDEDESVHGPRRNRLLAEGHERS